MRYKRDYKIIIEADCNDIVFWNVLRKGDPSLAEKEDLQVISEMLGTAKSHIDKALKGDSDE
jgi:hypothetical protein